MCAFFFLLKLFLFLGLCKKIMKYDGQLFGWYLGQHIALIDNILDYFGQHFA